MSGKKRDPSAEPRDRPMSIRWTEGEMNLLEEVREVLDVDLSEAIRALALRQASLILKVKSSNAVE